MYIYIALIVLSILLIIISKTLFYKNNVLRRTILLIVIIILFCLTIFRSEFVGTDYFAYNGYFFSDASTLKNIHYIEDGYVLLNSLAQKLGLFIIIPSFEFLISFFGMYKLSDVVGINKFVFISFYILTYTYMQSFNALRQFIAIGIICFGLYFVIKNVKYKWFLFVICVFVAASFHSSSYIALGLPILSFIKISKKSVVITFIVTMVLFFTHLGSRIVQPIAGLSTHYAAKYSGADSTFFMDSGGKGIIQMLPVMLEFIFLLLFLILKKKQVTKNADFILSSYLVFLFLYSAGGTGVVDRIQMFFLPFCIMANSYFIQFDLDKSKVLKEYGYLYKTVLVIFWITYCILRLMMNNANVVPYAFIH